MAKHSYTATLIKRGANYIAWVNEIPGVNTQGRTLAEIRENLKDALKMVLRENREIDAQMLAEEDSPRQISMRVSA